MRELQMDIGFELTIETNTMGIQQAFYQCVTIVDNRGKSE
jgi:hypothetical protein